MINQLILSVAGNWPFERGRDRGYRTLSGWSGFPKLLEEAGAEVRTRNGAVVVCQKNDRVSNWIRLYRQYELGTEDYLRKHLDPNKLFCDVGANVGYFGLFAAGTHAEQEVWAFEPNPAPRKCLEESVLRNGFEKRMEVMPVACSDAEGEMDLVFEEGLSGSGYIGSQLAAEGMTSCKVRATPFDVLAEERKGGRKPVGLFKIDVEGHEVQVLRGMTQILRDERPRVILEVVEEQLNRAGSSGEELYRLMASAGYRVETRFDLNVAFCPEEASK